MGSIFKGVKQFISGKFTESAEMIKGLVDGWRYFSQYEVFIGIPEENNEENESGISNAQLLYLHEQGVPSHNIPPRPVLNPALSQEEVRSKIKPIMRDAAAQCLMHGNKEAAERDFHKAGMIGRDACKKYITDGNNLAPNAPSTIRKKGSSTPLVDTASMLNSITYTIRKKR